MFKSATIHLLDFSIFKHAAPLIAMAKKEDYVEGLDCTHTWLALKSAERKAELKDHIYGILDYYRNEIRASDAKKLGAAIRFFIPTRYCAVSGAREGIYFEIVYTEKDGVEYVSIDCTDVTRYAIKDGLVCLNRRASDHRESPEKSTEPA